MKARSRSPIPRTQLRSLQRAVTFACSRSCIALRLSWLDLIQKKFLNRKLPLPSGTGVDLTLDTTLNLDDLLGDYADYQRLRSSPPVQPAAATTETKPLETPR